MGCCNGIEECDIPVEFSPDATYTFTTPLAARLLRNLGLAAAGSGVLSGLVYFNEVRAGEESFITGPLLFGLAAGLMVLSFLAMSLGYLSGKVVRRVRVGPDGMRMERRNGKVDDLPWAKVRGYVYDGVTYVFSVEGGSVALKIMGLTREQKALLRRAIRAPIATGSMKWRGRPPRVSRRADTRGPFVVVALAFVAGVALASRGRQVLAGALLAGAAVYLVYAIVASRRTPEE